VIRMHTVCLVMVAVLFFLRSEVQAGIEIVKKKDLGLELFGTGQFLGLGEIVKDNVRKNHRVYFFMTQARLGFSGNLEDYKFYTELELGGENTPASETSLTLLETRFDVPTWTHTYLRLGQFKTPYGAEFLTPDNERLFTENSIANRGANWGREIGLELIYKTDCINWAAGVFAGAGMGSPVLPPRALPQNFGSPLMVVRVGMDNTGADAVTHKQAKVFKIEKTEKALYLQGAYQIDTIMGHSSAMDIKSGQADVVYQQNLLLNPAWNPYINIKEKARLYSVGLNGVLKTLRDEIVYSGEFEADVSGFHNSLGTLTMYTARIQGSAAKKPWEAAMRLATLIPDKNMGPIQNPGLIKPAPFYEVTPALSYYLKDWSKLILECQLLVNVPVAHEPEIGAYVLSDMPSLTTYTSGTTVLPNRITRDFVPELKLMWQITL